jgi:hypothetical protein
MARPVAIVFIPDYSVELENLSLRMPVWLADTPSNRGGAEEAWRAAAQWPQISVTLFRPPAGAPTTEDWHTMLEQITLHERSFDALEVFGAELSEVAREALVEGGFTRFDEMPSGFKAKKW